MTDHEVIRDGHMTRTAFAILASMLVASMAEAGERVVPAEEIESVLLRRTLSFHAGAAGSPQRYNYAGDGRYWSLEVKPELTHIILGTYRVAQGRLCHRRDIDGTEECFGVRRVTGQGYVAINDANERLRIVVQPADWSTLRKRCERTVNATWEDAIVSCTMLIDFGRASWKDGVTLHLRRGALWPYGDERKLRDYDEAIRLDPLSAESFASRGDVFATLDQHERSRRDYDRAISLNPAGASLFARRASLSMKQGDYNRAIRDYDQAIRLEPSNTAFLVGRGDAHLYRAQYDDAIRDYSRAGDRVSRGFAYLLTEQYDRAISDFDSARPPPPNDWMISDVVRSGLGMAHYARGHVHARRGRYEQAILDFGEADRAGMRRALSSRCWALAIVGRLEAALSDCEMSLGFPHHDTEALSTRGFVHLLAGRLDAAIADYDAALRLTPDSAGALHGRAIARRRRGDPPAEVEADLLRARSIRGDIAEVMAAYGVR